MKASDSLLETVRYTVKDHRMIKEGDRVVAAVSGGADSVCLLDVLSRLAPELGLSLAVAHFDHGLRGAQDESETGFVRDLAEGRGLPFYTEKASPPLQDQGGSLEERAREARYAFLEMVRQEHCAASVAVGHTLDDQAETVLMRLLRGTGPSGLSGIPPVREPGIIRPLIKVRRRDIESYLEANGLSWRLDPTNLKTYHLRNRVRLELLPLLLDFQPKLVEHLGELADLIRDEDALMARLAQGWLKENASKDPGPETALPLDLFLREHPALQRRIVRAALLEQAGGLRRIDREHVRAVTGLARGVRPQAGLDLPGGLEVRRSYDQLVFGSVRFSQDRAVVNHTFSAPGDYTVGRAGLRMVLELRNPDGIGSLNRGPWNAFLDAGSLRFPLTLRSVRPGDRFVPLGMQGRRKVKDFLIDRKVPFKERSRAMLLLSGETPLWLCGYRIDERFKVRESTERVLEVRIVLSFQDADKMDE